MLKIRRQLVKQKRTKDLQHVNSKLQLRQESSSRTLMTQVLASSVTLVSSNLSAQNKRDSIRFMLLLRILLTSMLDRQLESEEEFTIHVLKVKCASLQFVKDMPLFKQSSLLAKASARVWLITSLSFQKNQLLKLFATSSNQTLQLKAAHSRLNSKLLNSGVSTNQFPCYLSNWKMLQEKYLTRLLKMVNNPQQLKNQRKESKNWLQLNKMCVLTTE